MIEKLSSKLVYENPWMKVNEDKVKFPNGHEGIYGVVDKPDFALVVPYENEGFYLVKQYRYPVKGSYWEFPQGTFNPIANDPTKMALKELKEETGLVPGKVDKLGFLYEAYGYCNQGFHVFLTKKHTQESQCLEITESDMVSKWFSIKDFELMIDKGEIRDAPTVSAYALFCRKI